MENLWKTFPGGRYGADFLTPDVHLYYHDHVHRDGNKKRLLEEYQRRMNPPRPHRKVVLCSEADLKRIRLIARVLKANESEAIRYAVFDLHEQLKEG